MRSNKGDGGVAALPPLLTAQKTVRSNRERRRRRQPSAQSGRFLWRQRVSTRRGAVGPVFRSHPAPRSRRLRVRSDRPRRGARPDGEVEIESLKLRTTGIIGSHRKEAAKPVRIATQHKKQSACGRYGWAIRGRPRGRRHTRRYSRWFRPSRQTHPAVPVSLAAMRCRPRPAEAGLPLLRRGCRRPGSWS